MITQQRLQELLHYNESTGVFVWRVSRSRVKVGSVAGTVSADGYIRIKIDGRVYFAHRLAWLYSCGSFPPAEIDHRDRCPGNNRISNLRPATRSDNNLNMRDSTRGSSGYKGVSLDKRSGKWRVRPQVCGKRQFLGSFLTAEAASAAYEDFAKRTHGEFYLAKGAI